MDLNHDLESQNPEQANLGAEDKVIHASETPAPPGLESGSSSSPIGLVPSEDGDFDDWAAEFWSVYAKEAQRHDKAVIGTWKEDMEAVIIFAGLYSATLTTFIIESRKQLTLDPSDEIVYYSRQSVALLAQISAQLAASGSPVPSTFVLPPAFPTFHVAQSDLRVNIYWFMSLVFSLSAALAATLVQQWAREYVHIFQRYGLPIKCARIRQFLYEGADKWKMEVVVNLVPALIHVSLFLFFLGLADSLFKINTVTAVTTTSVIVICALCYLFSIIAPICDAKSPYQSPLSGVFWHVFFQASRRKCNDRPVNTNMTEGRVQLAMAADLSGHRKDRDAGAIEWIVDNLIEDNELERLIRNIPHSFNSDWGKAVWDAVGEMDGSEPSGPSTNLMTRLNNRIAHLLRTCTDPGALLDEAERQRRAHACIDASLTLIIFVKDYKWTWLIKLDLPPMVQVLDDLRKIPVAKVRDAQIREAPTSEFDSTPSIRWACISTIIVCRILQTFKEVGTAAGRVIEGLAEVSGATEGGNDHNAAKTARTIDKFLKTSWDSATSLHKELIHDVDSDKVEDRVRNIMLEKKADIANLDYSWNICGWAKETDEAIVNLSHALKEATNGVIHHFPGAILPWKQDSLIESEEGTQSTPSFFMPLFIPPRLLIQRLRLSVLALRSISSTGWGTNTQKWTKLADISAPELTIPEMRRLMVKTGGPMEIQLWRLQDLRSGGLVYSLELFIQVIKSSGKAALRELPRKLYGGTFLFITRRWREEYTKEVWTERLLVDLLRRVLPVNGDLSSDQVPPYIVDYFLTFLAEVLEKGNGSHVQDAISQVKAYFELSGYASEAAREALSKLERSGT